MNVLPRDPSFWMQKIPNPRKLPRRATAAVCLVAEWMDVDLLVPWYWWHRRISDFLCEGGAGNIQTRIKYFPFCEPVPGIKYFLRKSVIFDKYHTF